jgi:formate dehydrogenase iron-sulfur subunit
MAEKAILIDTSKCIACKGCQIACKQWNELDAGKPEFFSGTDGYENPTDLSYITYNLIKFHLTEKTNGDPDWLFRKYQCMHCTEAACLASCPVDTIKRADNGFVYIDQTGCIGCGTCVSVCPFGIPKLSTAEEEEDGSPKSYKCWGCQDRIDAGKEPACVHTCAPDAATYGDWNDKRDDALARRDELIAAGFADANVYGIDELGGLHYIYVLLKDPSFYGLPSAAELSSSARRAYLKYMKEVGKLFLKKVSSF